MMDVQICIFEFDDKAIRCATNEQSREDKIYHKTFFRTIERGSVSVSSCSLCCDVWYNIVLWQFSTLKYFLYYFKHNCMYQIGSHLLCDIQDPGVLHKISPCTGLYRVTCRTVLCEILNTVVWLSGLLCDILNTVVWQFKIVFFVTFFIMKIYFFPKSLLRSKMYSFKAMQIKLN